MADYEPLRRPGHKKTKICVSVSVVIAIAVVVAVVVVFLWKPKPLETFISMNSTNLTTDEVEPLVMTGNDTISFNITMRLQLSSQSKQRRAVDCGDALSDFNRICNETSSDFKRCDEEKLEDYLEKYISQNFLDEMLSSDDTKFDNIKSTDIEIDIFNTDTQAVEAKARVTLVFVASEKSSNDTEEEFDAQVYIDSLKKSFDRCSNFIAASYVGYGSELYKMYENNKVLEGFLGNWKVVTSENFDAVLQALGVNYFLRQIAKSSKSDIKVEYLKDENKWSITTASSLTTTKIVFEIGKEFDEKLQDGRKVKTTVTIEDKKVVQTQRNSDGQIITILTRQLVSENEHWVFIKVGNVEAKRIYTRA